MSPLEIVFWILAFAVVSMILYGWGLRKSMNQQRDLLSLLYQKGADAVKKALKKNGAMSRAQLEQTLSGIQASQFYSKNRVVVKDPHAFSKELLEMMTVKGFLLLEDGAYRLNPAHKKR